MNEVENGTRPKPERLEAFLNAKYGNIISELDENLVQRIGASAVKEYKEDYNDPDYARKRENWKDGQDLVKQVIEAKDFPFEGAANVKYPLLTNAAVEFASRAYPELVPGHNVAKPKISAELRRRHLRKQL